ncbi:MAG: hypothetical protein QOF29_3017, partial [bacterium]
MRVGLVLGAGGVIGGSWLIGALDALEAETGGRAADAEQIVGTSAGAVIGALAAAGVAPESMSAYASGRTLDDVADAEARAAETPRRASAGEFQLQPGGREIRLMGFNLMSGARRLEVMEQARRSVAQQLRRLRARRALLPPRTSRRRRATAPAPRSRQ